MYCKVTRYSRKAALAKTVALGTLCFFTASALRAQTTSSASTRMLPTNTRFFVPTPALDQSNRPSPCLTVGI